LFVGVLTQQSAQTLHVFADAAGAGEDDADIGGGNIDAFVEYLAGDDHVVLAGMETLEDLLAFARLRLMRDRRRQKATRDLVDARVIVSEYDDAILGMAVQQFVEQFNLRGGGDRQPLLLAVRLERGSAIGS